MRLFLSSFRLGNEPDALAQLAGHGARAAIVLNALDNLPDFPRAPWLAREIADLGAVGIAGRGLDLRDYYGRPAGLRDALAETSLVWLTGGNAFVLREALHRSGLDLLLLELLKQDAITWGWLTKHCLMDKRSWWMGRVPPSLGT